MKDNTEQQIVLFDFDGVIIDSCDISFNSLKKYVFPDLNRKSFYELYYGNIIKSTGGSTVKLVGKQKTYSRIYGQEILRAKIFPGMVKAIGALSAYTRIIISSALTSAIRNYLRANKVANLFDDILGGDSHVDKGEKIKMILNKYGAKTDGCIFITDTLGDLREAKVTGVKSIAVTWGYHNKRILSQENPVFAKNAKELVKIINKYFERG